MGDCKCICWCAVWFVVLLVLAWPVSLFLALLFGVIAPITTLLALDDVSEALLKGANLGRKCALNAINGKPLF